MTQITRDDVLQQARLSNISLKDDEVDRLQQDLSKILDYVEQLNELDTDGVEPTFQVNSLENQWREDSINDSVKPADLLALAPKVKTQQIKVAKVL